MTEHEQLDPLGHHVHEPEALRERNVPVIALSIVVAACCAVITWLLLTRGHNADTSQKNRELIQQLACQVQRLGGAPVDGASCPPSPQPSATPAPSVTYSPKVVIVPGGGTRTVLVPVPASPSSQRTARPRPSRFPSPKPSHSPSPSPSPSICIAGHCISPSVGLRTPIFQVKELP